MEMHLSCFQFFDVPFINTKASLQYLKFAFAVILCTIIFLYDICLLKLFFIMPFKVFCFMIIVLFPDPCSEINLTKKKKHDKEKHVE
jgi:hypothetical protein